MRLKYVIILIFAALFILGWPISSLASSQNDPVSIGASDVKAIVNPQYEFSVPDDAEILYPQTSEYLGEFVIENLLLTNGETLNVNLVTWPMEKISDTTKVLPYTVTFSSPDNFTAAQVGESYGVSVSVDSAAFSTASTGVYRAKLLFQVISSPSGLVVWEEPVFVDAVKRETTGVETDTPDEVQDDVEVVDETDNQTDNQTDDQDDDQGEDVVVEVTDDHSESDNVSLDDKRFIGLFWQWFGTWWWIFVIIGAIALLSLLFILLKKRKQIYEEE